MKSGSSCALVTGASAGIGEEIARELARRHYDVILVARREDKLRALAASLEPHAAVTVLPLDLSEPDAAMKLHETLSGRRVDLLVNNAGFGDYGLFVESDPATMLALLQVNVVALTQLTRLFLPAMVERKSGGILNVASTAAFFPGPLMSVYYASKAYVLSFSEALANELERTGVTVTCLCPGPTKTEFQERVEMTASRLMQGGLMDAQTVARHGVDAVLRGDVLSVPGLVNRLNLLLPRLLPRRMLADVVRRAQERA